MSSAAAVCRRVCACIWRLTFLPFSRVCARVCVCARASLCLSVYPHPSPPAGSVSCACCADNQCVTSAGSVQQEQGTGLVSTPTHTHTLHINNCSLLYHLEVCMCMRISQCIYFKFFKKRCCVCANILMKNKSFISLWTDRIDNLSSATTFAIFTFCSCCFYFWELCVPVILSFVGILFVTGLSYLVLLHIWQLKLNSSDKAVSRVFFSVIL